MFPLLSPKWIVNTCPVLQSVIGGFFEPASNSNHCIGQVKKPKVRILKNNLLIQDIGLMVCEES
jgi:hypothetical protein